VINLKNFSIIHKGMIADLATRDKRGRDLMYVFSGILQENMIKFKRTKEIIHTGWKLIS